MGQELDYTFQDRLWAIEIAALDDKSYESKGLWDDLTFMLAEAEMRLDFDVWLEDEELWFHQAFANLREAPLVEGADVHDMNMIAAFVMGAWFMDASWHNMLLFAGELSETATTEPMLSGLYEAAVHMLNVRSARAAMGL